MNYRFAIIGGRFGIFLLNIMLILDKWKSTACQNKCFKYTGKNSTSYLLTSAVCQILFKPKSSLKMKARRDNRCIHFVFICNEVKGNGGNERCFLTEVASSRKEVHIVPECFFSSRLAQMSGATQQGWIRVKPLQFLSQRYAPPSLHPPHMSTHTLDRVCMPLAVLVKTAKWVFFHSSRCVVNPWVWQKAKIPFVILMFVFIKWDA